MCCHLAVQGKAKDQHPVAAGSGSNGNGSSSTSSNGASLSRSNWRTALATAAPESHGLGSNGSSNGSNGSSKRFSW